MHQGASTLLNELIRMKGLKNDAALCRFLEVQPPIISKMRNGMLPFGASMIIRIHDAFGMPIREIKALLCGQLAPQQAAGNRDKALLAGDLVIA